MQLDQLPECVKRNIFGRVLAPKDTHDAHDISTPAAVPASTSFAEDIAGRAVLLPALRAGAAIVDGVLSRSESQVGCIRDYRSHRHGLHMS
jgi:uracil phosphoribosyltransferase